MAPLRLVTERLELRPLPAATAAVLLTDRDRATSDLDARLSEEWPQPALRDILPRQAAASPATERFGIWVTFYGFTQDAYLAVVDSRLGEAGFDAEQIRAAREPALQWALERGARSGRIAAQFVRDYVGRLADESDADESAHALRTG